MRYFLSILLIVGVVVLAIFLIARDVHKTVNPPPNVTSYDTSDSSVVLTTSGNVVGEEKRAGIQIVVTQSSRTVNILSGYEQTVTSTATTPNTPAAYTTFLQAIQVAGFTKYKATTQKYMFAACPLGLTYQYQLNNVGKSVSNLWGTNCSVLGGSFDGSGPLLITLFQLQIPNYQAFVTNVTLNY